MSMECKNYPLCPDCKSPVVGPPHTARICMELLRRKLDESERERRISEGTVEWLVKAPENIHAL